MYLLPSLSLDGDSVVLSSGKLYKPYGFCEKNVNKRRCAKFIESIADRRGFCVCPYGFTCYVQRAEGIVVVSCSIRVQDHYNPRKTRAKVTADESPVLSEEFVRACISESLSTEIVNDKVEEAKEFLEVTLHEIRKLNRDIKSQSEDLTAILDSGDSSRIKYLVQNIFGTSSLISVRLDTFDMFFNPDLITSSAKIPFPAYRRFEKTMHCLNSLCRKKRVRIELQGSSYNEIDAYPVIELLPYVLLENAIKYSPSDQQIYVNFSPNSVVVENMGPLVKGGEVDRIFQKRYRGRYAKESFSGTGNGLYFARQVCDIHDIEISASADSVKYRVDKVPYSSFKITLKIPYDR